MKYRYENQVFRLQVHVYASCINLPFRQTFAKNMSDTCLHAKYMY